MLNDQILVKKFSNHSSDLETDIIEESDEEVEDEDEGEELFTSPAWQDFHYFL